jgi:hypothetical protein
MTGKNFSCCNLGKRKKSDFYETPYSITRQLLDRVQLRGSILEPAAGGGAIVRVLKAFNYSPTFYDQETDFLKEIRPYTTVITNPPFSLSMEFIKKAKEISEEFYFLLPLSYLHGKKRYDQIYTDSYGLKRIFVFTRYPMLGEKLRQDGCYNTGMMVYAWFHFCKNHNSPALIQWIDNNEYVLKGGK